MPLKVQTFGLKPLPSFGDLARIVSVLVVFLYVAGILIRNFDLGRLGVTDLELARPEYVLIGAMWFVLTVSPIIL